MESGRIYDGLLAVSPMVCIVLHANACTNRLYEHVYDQHLCIATKVRRFSVVETPPYYIYCLRFITTRLHHHQKAPNLSPLRSSTLHP